MKDKYRNDYLFFVHQKLYVITVLLSVIMAYGYQLTHCSLAVDDICTDLYYSDGVGVEIGRWPFFIMHHWFNIDGITNFIPFIVDFFAVITIILGAVTWTVYIKKIADSHNVSICIWAYSIFVCLFISYSLIAQVWIYYLHNGIAIGYVLVGIAMMLLFDAFEEKRLVGAWHIKSTLISSILICIAASFYESMIPVFMFGVDMYLLLAYSQNEKIEIKHIGNVVIRSVAVLLIAIGLRTCIIRAITVIYRLPYVPRQPKSEVVSATFCNWVNIVVDTICEYLLLPEYQPIRLFMMCTIMGGIYLLIDAVKKKRVRLIIIAFFTFLSLFSCTPFMNQVVPYRAMQVLTVYVAFCMMVFVQLCFSVYSHFTNNVLVPVLASVLVGIILWNNFCEINYSFYMEYENYVYNMDKIREIGHDLEKMGYDVEKEKVIIIGNLANSMPYPRKEDKIIEGSFWDKARRGIATAFNAYRDNPEDNYYQNISNDMFNWGVRAFGNQQQMVKFFDRAGYRISSYDLEDEILSSIDISIIPEFPMDGYIYKAGDVFVVNLNH